MTSALVRPASEIDAESIANIYNPYILSNHCTFELETLTARQVAGRIESIQKDYHWLVYEQDKKVLAYAYTCQWKPRGAYRQTAEISVYVDQHHTGLGIGHSLYEKLIHLAKEAGLHTLLAGIAQPNEGSNRFHEQFGFQKVGQLEEVGYKFGRWYDVAYYQLPLTLKPSQTSG